MQDTIDQIEIIAENTGINLDEAIQPAYELSTIRRKLRDATKASIGDAGSLAVSAVQGTAADFADKWDEALRHGINATIGRQIYERASDALMKREDTTAKEMGWHALSLLSAHVDELGRDLLALDLSHIGSAEQAIAANATKDYTRANEIIDKLQEIADLPEINRTGLRVWVLIKPPTLPDARPNTHGDKLADDHTPEELRLIGQASDIGKPNNLRGQLLAAINHGWKLSLATSEHEYTTRSRRWHAASHINVGALSRSI